MNQKITKELSTVLHEVWDKLQDRPHQYIVAYLKVADDSLIGYHASSFNQLTDDILAAKRYSGEDPYPQLKVVSEGLKWTLEGTHEGEIFQAINLSVQESFKGLKPEDIYLDAIYLAEGTPKQEFHYQIVAPESKIEIDMDIDTIENLN